jgi:hypothetical protein
MESTLCFLAPVVILKLPPAARLSQEFLVADQFAAVGPQLARLFDYFATLFVDALDALNDVARAVRKFVGMGGHSPRHVSGRIPAIAFSARKGDADSNRGAHRDADPDLRRSSARPCFSPYVQCRCSAAAERPRGRAGECGVAQGLRAASATWHEVGRKQFSAFTRWYHHQLSHSY